MWKWREENKIVIERKKKIGERSHRRRVSRAFNPRGRGFWGSSSLSTLLYPRGRLFLVVGETDVKRTSIELCFFLKGAK